MARHWFHPPVTVATDRPGVSYAVANVEGAAEHLLRWAHSGPMNRRAREACIKALAGDLDPSDVRPLFEAAAKEAGQLVR